MYYRGLLFIVLVGNIVMKISYNIYNYQSPTRITFKLWHQNNLFVINEIKNLAILGA